MCLERFMASLRSGKNGVIEADGTINDPVYAAGLHTAAKNWIHRCYSLGDDHGSRLAEELGAGGVMASSSLADRILECFERFGWIVRDDLPSSSRAQMFAGVGGRPPGKRPNKHNAYAHEFGFTVNRDSASLMNYIRSK